MAWPLAYDLDSSKFDDRATSRSNKPTIVLVHDAFHTPFHFEGLVRDLRAASTNVLTPQLPSSSSTYQPNIFQGDVQAVFDGCKPAMEAGHNLVLVLHGYSGLVGASAAVRLNQYALTRPRAGFVVKIIFVAALVADEGECFLDIYRPEWLIYENGLLRVRRPDQVFFNDCPAEVARSATAMVRPQLADSFRFRTPKMEWDRIESLYVVCDSDQAFPPSLQHTCLRKLQTLNRRTSYLSLQSGHSPYLSRTREMVALLIRIGTGS